MAEGLTAGGLARLHAAAGQHVGDEDLPGLVTWGFCQAVLANGCYGWDGGLGTSWLVDPVHDLVVITLTQRMFDGPTTPQAHRDIQVAAYAALG